MEATKRSSAEEWLKKTWNIHGILVIKEKETMPFSATRTDPEIIPSEVRQRKTNITYHLYVEPKKVIQRNSCTKQTDSQTQKTNLKLPKGMGVGWE